MFRKYFNCFYIKKLDKINYNKIKCNKCNIVFNTEDELNKHVEDEKLKTLRINLQEINEKNIKLNNIYKFEQNTLGEHIYKDNNGGNIYIIQNDLNMINYYKIGITTNLIKRLSTYRCGSVIEPKLYYYFPIKNIKLVDHLLKSELKKYVIKREIYKIDDLDQIINIIYNIQIHFESDKLIYQPIIK